MGFRMVRRVEPSAQSAILRSLREHERSQQQGSLWTESYGNKFTMVARIQWAKLWEHELQVRKAWRQDDGYQVMLASTAGYLPESRLYNLELCHYSTVYGQANHL